jgi:hypothetical protein
MSSDQPDPGRTFPSVDAYERVCAERNQWRDERNQLARQVADALDERDTARAETEQAREEASRALADLDLLAIRLEDTRAEVTARGMEQEAQVLSVVADRLAGTADASWVRSWAQRARRIAAERRATMVTRVDLPTVDSPQVWTLPDEPAVHVQAVRDRDGRLWVRDGSRWRLHGRAWVRGGVFMSWPSLVVNCWPLVDATADVADSPAGSPS